MATRQGRVVHVVDASKQTMILALALILWGLSPTTAWWALVLAYCLAWLVVNGWSALRIPRGVVLLAVAVPLSLLWSKGDALLDAEGLRGLPTHLADRLRLEGPSIAPGVVFTDHPQRFFVHSLGAERVRVRFGRRGATLEAVSLGEGLFRLSYDPRVHGEPREGEGASVARIESDGEWSESAMQVVRPSSHPRWFCGSPSRELAATVSEETDELLLIRPDGSVSSIRVGDGPSDCEFLTETLVAVSHRYGPTLWVVDVESRRVERRVPLGSGTRLAISPSRRELAFARPASVDIVDVATFQVTGHVETEADWAEFADEETLVVAARRSAHLVRARRADAWAPGPPLPLGRPAVTMARGGRGVFVATTGFSQGEAHFGNHFVQDQVLEIDAARWRIHSQRLTARRSPRQSSAGNVDSGVSPMGLESSDAGLRITFAGSDECWTWGEGPPQVIDLGELPAPHGLFTFSSGRLAVSSPSTGAIGVRIGDSWRIAEVGEAPRAAGERAFYESTRAGISCQSCHLHGDTDFVLRNIGGQRLAPTLGVGGVAGTSPYLRDGSYPRVRDLDHLAQTLFRGYLRRSGSRGEDIEAYVEGLPRRPNLRDGDLERERRGLSAFVSARCVTCHSFPAFTHLGQHPLGALFPRLAEDGERGADEVLDTPSLLSVSTHGPYLSDGRAESLSQVLAEHNKANRHGDTQALSEAELEDLVYFLEGL